MMVILPINNSVCNFFYKERVQQIRRVLHGISVVGARAEFAKIGSIFFKVFSPK
jgi:hypothetical protein